MVASAEAGGISLHCTFAGEFTAFRSWTMVPTVACRRLVAPAASS